mmetsp:Transcript_8224/g.22607  ORF Transcript_8224/g.22607 Transcript_8224/m.22607 type:complete len:231 (-) Transcript_8224:188-880(-)
MLVAWAKRSCPSCDTQRPTCSKQAESSYPVAYASRRRLSTSACPDSRVLISRLLSPSGSLRVPLPASGSRWTWTVEWIGRRSQIHWKSFRLTSTGRRRRSLRLSGSMISGFACVRQRVLCSAAATPSSGGSRLMFAVGNLHSPAGPRLSGQLGVSGRTGLRPWRVWGRGCWTMCLPAVSFTYGSGPTGSILLGRLWDSQLQHWQSLQMTRGLVSNPRHRRLLHLFGQCPL